MVKIKEKQFRYSLRDFLINSLDEEKIYVRGYFRKKHNKKS